MCSVNTYIVAHDLGYYGVLVNPPLKSNMICARTLQKYKMALQLFEKLKLPVVSFVSTSGADPRLEQLDKDIVSELNDVTIKIMNYPHPKIGIVNEKCYGGATVLTFPKIFGGDLSYVLRGSQLGVMHKTIIERLLENSPRLLSIFQKNTEEETEDYADLVDEDLIEEVISFSEIPNVLSKFLLRHKEVKKKITIDDLPNIPKLGVEAENHTELLQ